MHPKLNFKVFGVDSSDDLKIIEENLKSQDGIKNIKIAQLKNYVDIKLDIEENKINKQQVVDIIKLSGDFRVEELSESKTVEVTDKSKTTTVHPVPNLVAAENLSKTFFVWGLLVGFSVVSLFLNIVFGYLLFGSSTTNAQKDSASANNNQVVVNNPQPRPQVPSAPVQPTGPVQEFKITKNDNVRGNFNAPITLVEYSDFECPYCGKIYPTFKQLLNDYPNQVRLVYKYFPLSFHPNAQKAAEAAECASEQGKFWEYHDKLFDNQANGFSVANFKQWADDLGLNASKFNDCLDTGKYASKVQADEADGQNRGVNGTPATFVNGQLISGAVPYESFKSVIDQLLTK
jgi:protein-disulfide isomerase